jgi:hypothetical protein
LNEQDALRQQTIPKFFKNATHLASNKKKYPT